MYLTLPGSAVRTSRVGFGTSPLMSRVGRAQSLRLLEAALDAGITHFDTARLYGYGEAERVLGAFVAGRRDQVTITTKVGILPPQRSLVLSVAKSLARRAIALRPQLRARVRRRAGTLTQAGAFDLPTVAASFETSLRELGTDYVDFLMLHECSEADLSNPELLGFLDRAKQAGKVRTFGIATVAPVIETALVHFPALTSALQFRSSLFEPHLTHLRSHLRPGSAVFTHSALSTGFLDLLARLTSDPALRLAWNERLGLDCAQRQTLGKLCLQYALEDNPAGVVLVSSTNEVNLRANAALLSNPFPSERWEAFAELVQALPPQR